MQHSLGKIIGLIAGLTVLNVHCGSALTEEFPRGHKLVVVCYPEQGNPFLSVDVRAPRDAASRMVGVDAEILKRVAARLGVTVEFEVPTKVSVGQLFEEVRKGHADLAIGGLTITAERQKLVDFSKPYFSFQPLVIVRKGSSIRTYADLEGKIGAANRGSSLEAHLRDAGFKGARLVLTGFTIDTLVELEEDRVDFGLEDAEIVKNILEISDEVEVAFPFPVTDHYGFAAPKGSPMIETINTVLSEMEDAGELRGLIAERVAGRR